MNNGNKKLIALSVFLAVGLAACDKPGPAESAGKSVDQAMTDSGKKLEETADKMEKSLNTQGANAAQAMGDTEITTRVKTAVFAEEGLKTLQISVDTVKGVVTLTGNVNSQENSDKARALAAGVPDVVDVVNQLVVTPAS